jgi:hypothetical protein
MSQSEIKTENNSENKGLSDKAKEILRRNVEIRQSKTPKAKRYLYLDDGQEAIRRFDPEQIEPQEIDYTGNGEKTQRFDYTVIDPDTGEIEIFRASITVSGDIDALLAEGYSLLKIRRKGTRYETKYHITPVKET